MFVHRRPWFAFVLSFCLSLSPLVVVLSSHQLNPIDEHQSHPATDESSGTPLSSARSQSRPLPTSHAYWLNTGDNHNQTSSNFMRSTFTATCRARVSRSTERCSRAGRGILSFPQREFLRFRLNWVWACSCCRCASGFRLALNMPNIHVSVEFIASLAYFSAREEPLNGESHRRPTTTTRQHLHETIARLAKPRTNAMTQSIHVGATPTSTNGMPMSRSSHQIRLTTSTTAAAAASSSTRKVSQCRRAGDHQCLRFLSSVILRVQRPFLHPPTNLALLPPMIPRDLSILPHTSHPHTVLRRIQKRRSLQPNHFLSPCLTRKLSHSVL